MFVIICYYNDISFIVIVILFNLKDYEGIPEVFTI